MACDLGSPVRSISAHQCGSVSELRRRKGISLIEVTIILLVLGIIAGALAPTLLRSMRKTKLARARADVCVIRDAIVNMLADVGTGGLLQDGSVPTWA